MVAACAYAMEHVKRDIVALIGEQGRKFTVDVYEIVDRALQLHPQIDRQPMVQLVGEVVIWLGRNADWNDRDS